MPRQTHRRHSGGVGHRCAYEETKTPDIVVWLSSLPELPVEQSHGHLAPVRRGIVVFLGPKGNGFVDLVFRPRRSWVKHDHSVRLLRPILDSIALWHPRGLMPKEGVRGTFFQAMLGHASWQNTKDTSRQSAMTRGGDASSGRGRPRPGADIAVARESRIALEELSILRRRISSEEGCERRGTIPPRYTSRARPSSTYIG